MLTFLRISVHKFQLENVHRSQITYCFRFKSRLEPTCPLPPSGPTISLIYLAGIKASVIRNGADGRFSFEYDPLKIFWRRAGVSQGGITCEAEADVKMRIAENDAATRALFSELSQSAFDHLLSDA